MEPDQSQVAAIKAPLKDPVLVTASAGTGKTTTLIERIRYLVENGVSPEKILALTFTNEAAHELVERLAEKGIAGVWAGTFHKLCGLILRKNRKFNLVTDGTRQMIIAYLLCEHVDQYAGYTPDHRKVKRAARREENRIGRIKNMVPPRGRSKIFAEYQNYLREHEALDYDDLLLHALSLLKKGGELWKNRWSYLLVDEFQDNNKTQYEIIKCFPTRAIFAVGDFSQSIYAFRGAWPENINNYKVDFSPIEKELKTNYRCAKKIHKLSQKVIRNNNAFIPRGIETKEDAPEGSVFKCNGDEFRVVAEDICRQRARGMQDIAVLYRKRPGVFDNLILELRNSGVDYVCMDDFTKIISLLFNILQFVTCPTNNLLYQTAAYSFGRWQEDVQPYLDNNDTGASLFKKTADDAARSGNVMVQIVELINEDNNDAKGNLNKILEYLRNNQQDIFHQEYDQKTWGNIANAFEPEITEANSNWTEFIDDLPLRVGIRDICRRIMKANKSRVRLMTIHAAKGLEFDLVYFVNAVPEDWPRDNTGGKENQRLCYVAVTRAKKYLVISSSGIEPLHDYLN